MAFGALTATSGVSLLYTIDPVCAALGGYSTLATIQSHLSPLLGLFNIILYAGPYTLSKPYSEVNTWIGSVVGAVPPLIGWAGATAGDLVAYDPLFLASILYFWQFPHFFALSWLHREDYARGNFQMVAVNDPVGQRSADLIFRYAVYLAAIPIISSMTGVTSYMFAVEGCLLNGYLLFLSHRFSRDHSNQSARKVFLTTLWYLPLLLAGFVYHNHNWDKLDATVRSSMVSTESIIEAC